MSRELTGTLVHQKRGWCARIPQVVEGVRVKPIYFLGTDSRALAKRRMQRLIADLEAGKVPDENAGTRPETVAEAAGRWHVQRVKDGVKSAKTEIARLRAFALPTLSALDVTAVEPTDINEALDECKAAGKSRQTAEHLKMDLSNVFAMLKREGAIKASPVDDATLPKFQKQVTKQRAVLTDAELARYLAWAHPQPRFREAALERQMMSIVARCFGGLRTGDLHAIRWESFDVEGGRFAFGWAPRQKTGAPQKLEVPAVLRPFLHDWWERRGRPTQGVLFAARRGKRVGAEKKKTSHAEAFRRDLERAFGLVTWKQTGTDRKGNPVGVWEPTPGRVRTRRELELFEPTDFTLPVDFHSWRRAYSQALAEAEVTLQQAQALAGHASLAAHSRYIQSAQTMRSMPAAALPAWGSSDISGVQSSWPAVQNDQEAPRKTGNHQGERASEKRRPVQGNLPPGSRAY